MRKNNLIKVFLLSTFYFFGVLVVTLISLWGAATLFLWLINSLNNFYLPPIKTIGVIASMSVLWGVINVILEYRKSRKYWY
ncbi:hypothetical protein BKK53_11470 [Rodentibacter trehalosifermentans]|nr:hypothetical protein BKK53_11470 [Rodentibacter trehalosifermentans]